MCGRYSLTTPLDALIALFDLPATAARPNLAPRWNIAPTQSVPAVRTGAAGRELAMLRWGFAGPGTAPLINARAETAAAKPSFRDAFAHRRCLLPADGFYEWQAVAGQKAKQPWRIGMKGGGTFAFAGLWQEEPALGNAACATILTVAANDYLAPLHERMPVIVAPDDYGAWLDPHAPVDRLRGLLRPYPAELMARYRVGSAVNSVRNDTAECFAPLNPDLKRG